MTIERSIFARKVQHCKCRSARVSSWTRIVRIAVGVHLIAFECCGEYFEPSRFERKRHLLFPSSSSRDTNKLTENDVTLLASCDRNDCTITFSASVAGLCVYNWAVVSSGRNFNMTGSVLQHRWTSLSSESVGSTVSAQQRTVNRPERRLSLAVHKYGKLIIDLKIVVFCIGWDSLVSSGCSENKSRSIFRRFSLFPPSRRSSSNTLKIWYPTCFYC